MRRNYENSSLLVFIILIYLILVGFMIVIYFNKTYRSYNLISVIVVTDNYVKTYVDNETLKELKSTSRFYIDDKIVNYEIIEVDRNVISRKNKSYHGLLLKTNFSNKYKDNDSIDVSIYSYKKKIYTIFKKCWESD